MKFRIGTGETPLHNVAYWNVGNFPKFAFNASRRYRQLSDVGQSPDLCRSGGCDLDRRGRLTRALDAIAARTRLGHVFVGMLLLGGITSLPELANVATASSSSGNPLLAVADALIGRKDITSIVAQPSTMMMAARCMIVPVDRRVGRAG